MSCELDGVWKYEGGNEMKYDVGGWCSICGLNFKDIREHKCNMIILNNIDRIHKREASIDELNYVPRRDAFFGNRLSYGNWILKNGEE